MRSVAGCYPAATSVPPRRFQPAIPEEEVLDNVSHLGSIFAIPGPLQGLQPQATNPVLHLLEYWLYMTISSNMRFLTCRAYETYAYLEPPHHPNVGT